MTASFPTSLGDRERQLNVVVGYGVGIGLPCLFALIFGLPLLWAGHWSAMKVAALPFVVLGFLVWFRRYRPMGLTLTGDEILVDRPVGSLRLATIGDIIALGRRENPPTLSRGVGGLGSAGFCGSWGTFRNDEHGEFGAWLTNAQNVVEFQLNDGSFAFVTPDEPDEFITAVIEIGRSIGVEIEKKGMAA